MYATYITKGGVTHRATLYRKVKISSYPLPQKKCLFSTHHVQKGMKIFFRRVKFIFWPERGRRFYTKRYRAKRGEARYKIEGRMKAKKRQNFTLRKNNFHTVLDMRVSNVTFLHRTQPLKTPSFIMKKIKKILKIFVLILGLK